MVEWFEDLKVGMRFKSEAVTVSKDDIVRFAREYDPQTSAGSPGIDELRWLKPVRPGDQIHLEGELVELVPSRSKPHGVARIKWTAYNQHGEAVYAFNPIAIVPSRPK